MMDVVPDQVFAKTEKGQVELKQRQFGLNPRARQLLILIDGHRRYADLCKLLPEKELVAYLMLLEGEGFVARLQAAAVAASLSVHESIEAAAPAEPFAVVRQRMVRAFIDTVGPAGDDFTVRIERSANVQELRELLPAALSIVEAVGGRSGTQTFLQRVGRI